MFLLSLEDSDLSRSTAQQLPPEASEVRMLCSVLAGTIVFCLYRPCIVHGLSGTVRACALSVVDRSSACGVAATRRQAADEMRQPPQAASLDDPSLMVLDITSDGHALCFNIDAVGPLPEPPKRLTGNESHED